MLRIAPYDEDARRKAEERNREAWARERRLSEEARHSQTHKEMTRRESARKAEEKAAVVAHSKPPKVKPAPSPKSARRMWHDDVNLEEVEHGSADEGLTYIECAKRSGVSRATFAKWYTENSEIAVKRQRASDFSREDVLKIYNTEYIHRGTNMRQLSISMWMARQLFEREDLPIKDGGTYELSPIWN